MVGPAHVTGPLPSVAGVATVAHDSDCLGFVPAEDGRVHDGLAVAAHYTCRARVAGACAGARVLAVFVERHSHAW